LKNGAYRAECSADDGKTRSFKAIFHRFFRIKSGFFEVISCANQPPNVHFGAVFHQNSVENHGIFRPKTAKFLTSHAPSREKFRLPHIRVQIQTYNLDMSLAVFGMRALEVLFFTGLVGSTVVVLISFVEDGSELFGKKE
jgi:hypothetical protein